MAPPTHRAHAGAHAILALTIIAPALLSAGDTDYVQVALVVGLLILSLGIHEAAHAWTAWRCGDSTAKDMGRMTLDPFAHIDLVWTILLPIVFFVSTGYAFGGAKPVPVDYRRLRKPARDMMLVALAGPASNLVLAILFMLIWKTLIFVNGMALDQLPVQVMKSAVFFNILLAVFNMIPIPPLDGSRVVSFLLRGQAREAYAMFERFGFLLLMVLVFTGKLWPLIGPAMTTTFNVFFKITGGAWS